MSSSTLWDQSSWNPHIFCIGEDQVVLECLTQICLLRATKNPFYLHVGRDILYNLNNHTKAVCGYATVHDVQVSAIKLVFSCISETVILILRTRVWRTDRKASSYQRLSRFCQEIISFFSHLWHNYFLKIPVDSLYLLQYLYLLFDVDNPVNLHASNYLFTTEGHILPISNRLV